MGVTIDVEMMQENLSNVREKLLGAIEALSEEALVTPGAIGEWSVADALAIIAAWEAELVTGLSDAQRGKRPARLLNALSDPATYEATRYAEYRDRDLDEIFDDLQGARIQLEIRLEDLTTRDLNDARRYRWSKKKPLWRTIAEASYEREKDLIAPIEAFSARWIAEHGPADESPVIDLIDVEVWQNGDQ